MSRVWKQLSVVGLVAVLVCGGFASVKAQEFGGGSGRLVVDPDHCPHTPRLGFTGHMHYGQGMYVERVRRGSLAERLGLEAGDIIVEINGRRIRSDRDYAWALTEAAQHHDGHIDLLIDNVRARNGWDPGAQRFVTVHGHLDSGLEGPSGQRYAAN